MTGQTGTPGIAAMEDPQQPHRRRRPRTVSRDGSFRADDWNSSMKGGHVTTFVERIVGDLGDKRRWRQYRARVKALPSNYRATVEALERYLTYFGMITKGDDVPADVLMSMLGDLADLFERATANGTPIRVVIGDDGPVEFAETFFRNYSDGQWISKEPEQSVSAIEREFHKEIERGINKERERLVKAIEHAEANDVGNRS
jgi:DNA-binding ferritin-like protein (Dps family)